MITYVMVSVSPLAIIIARAKLSDTSTVCDTVLNFMNTFAMCSLTVIVWPMLLPLELLFVIIQIFL